MTKIARDQVQVENSGGRLQIIGRVGKKEEEYWMSHGSYSLESHILVSNIHSHRC